MPPKPIQIGEQYFARKADAVAAIRAAVNTLATTPTGTADAEALLLDLLQLHPRAAEKIGRGVTRVEIRVSPASGRRELPWLIRVDHSESEFSWHKCLDPPSHDQEVRNALRWAVEHQIAGYRQAEFLRGAGRCAECHIDLTGNGGHVDHVDPTFMDMSWDYVTATGGWEAFELRRPAGKLGVRLADPDQERRWTEHHRKAARLRLLCANHNLQRKKGQLRRS